MKPFTGFLKISTLSVALLATTAIVASVAMPDVAYAGKGNGNGNGGGNGGNSADKGNSGKSGADKGNSAKSKAKGTSAKAKSKSKRASGNPIKAIGDLFKKKSDAPKVKRASKTKSVAKTKRVVKTAPTETSAPKPRGNPLVRTLGVHPSELGALNAANASPNALANASPNSRVGKLAIYAGEVEAGRELEADLLAAQEVLDTLDAPERDSAQIDAAIADADAIRTTRMNDLDGLLVDLEAAGGEDADIEAQIETATADIGTLDEEIAALTQERADGEAYESAAEDVATLEEDLATQADTQRAALEAAANKEVTDAVEAAVQSLLGIDQLPETDSGDDVVEDIVEEDDIVALD
ncbi:MAG: hypothetical protein ABJF50_08390 [Paracoccaceae bacterium]